MYQVNCEKPVLILSPLCFQRVLQCNDYFVDGQHFTIDNEIRGRVLSGQSVSRVLGLNYVRVPERKPEFSDGEWHAVENRFQNFLDNSFFLSLDGECFPIWQFVPCNHCDTCKAVKLYSYVQRCQLAYEESKVPAYFVTLTYNDKHYSGVPVRRDLQLFMKRLRRSFDSSGLEHQVKYCCSSERGLTGRVHYHLVLFGLPLIDCQYNSQRLYKITKYIQYAWRDPERLGRNYRSFDSYCKEFPLSTCLTQSYDPFSKGFVNVKEIDDASATAYVLKYAFKNSDVPDSVVVTYKHWFELEPYDYVQLDSSKRISFSSDDFHCISGNMGLEFVREHLDGVLDQREPILCFVSEIDSMLKVYHLSGYYIKKLLPSESSLIPVDIRKAYFNVIFFCEQLSKYRFCPPDIRSASIATSLWCRNKYSVVMLGFNDIFLDSWDTAGDYGVDSSIHESIKSSYITETLQLIAYNVQKLNCWNPDFDAIKLAILKRSKFFSKLTSQHRDIIVEKGKSFVEQMKDLQCRSYI